MLDDRRGSGISRRGLLLLAAGAAAAHSGQPVWERKPSSEWTADQIDRLLTRSPWAKEVAAAAGGGRGRAQAEGIVRWESARPILEAMRAPLPESFAGQYVISVNGFPLEANPASEAERADLLERIRAVTTLQVTGKPLVAAAMVDQQVTTGIAASLLFGFPKNLVALGPEDREITFVTHLGRLTIQTRFNVREMIYRGELAL